MGRQAIVLGILCATMTMAGCATAPNAGREPEAPDGATATPQVTARTQTLPLVVYSEFQGGDLEASIAAASILVLAAFGVLVSVRAVHWRRALDVRTGS